MGENHTQATLFFFTLFPTFFKKFLHAFSHFNLYDVLQWKMQPDIVGFGLWCGRIRHIIKDQWSKGILQELQGLRQFMTADQSKTFYCCVTSLSKPPFNTDFSHSFL